MSLKPVRRKGSPYWYVRGSVCGRPVYKSTKIPLRRKPDAKKHCERIEAEIIKDHVSDARQGAALCEVAKLYQDGLSRFDRGLVERLSAHFGTTDVGDIDQARIDHAARVLYPRSSPESLNRTVYTPMSALMRYAARLGLCRWDGLTRPRQKKPPRDRWITTEEAGRLLLAAEPRLRKLIIFLLYTGARLGEALRLEWRDVDLARRHVSLYMPKTRRRRAVALNETVFEALANMQNRATPALEARQSRGAVPLAPRQSEGFVFPWRTRGAVYKHWHPACAKAGLADLTPHDLRHTYATWLRMYAKADLRQLMAVGDWRDVRSVARYAHVSSDELRDVVSRLPNVLNPCSGGKIA